MNVENGVPLPPRKAFGRDVKYPFHDMRIGQSFSRPAEERHRVSAAASMHGRRHGMRFTTRVLVEKGVEVVRCWREA